MLRIGIEVEVREVSHPFLCPLPIYHSSLAWCFHNPAMILSDKLICADVALGGRGQSGGRGGKFPFFWFQRDVWEIFRKMMKLIWMTGVGRGGQPGRGGPPQRGAAGGRGGRGTSELLAVSQRKIPFSQISYKGEKKWVVF